MVDLPGHQQRTLPPLHHAQRALIVLVNVALTINALIFLRFALWQTLLSLLGLRFALSRETMAAAKGKAIAKWRHLIRYKAAESHSF